METRIALIGIIVENPDSVEQLNHLLHEYGSFIVGRMGIPYDKKYSAGFYPKLRINRR